MDAKKFQSSLFPALLFAVLAFVGCIPPVYSPTENIKISACLADPECTQKLSVAHRGTGSLNVYAPENTAAAFEIAWKMGADSVEIDVRRTRDGELVIMHDETLDRTTSGRGRVSDLDLAEIKALKVKSFSKSVPDQEIPTLREVMSLMKGKAMVYVDVKNSDDLEDTVRVIEEEGMLDQAYILIGSLSEGYAARAQSPAITLLPVVRTKEQSEEYIKAIGPIFMFEMLYEDATPELVEFIHSQGIKVHMDALGWFDLLGSCGFNMLLSRGADSIQSDRIDVLVPYLRGR